MLGQSDESSEIQPMASAVQFQYLGESCLRKTASGGESLGKVVFVCRLIDPRVLDLRM